MNTKVLGEDNIQEAADIIKHGGLVAIPTETVYGLAANALDGDSVAKMFVAKGRPMDNPVIVHISDIAEIYKLVSDFPEKAKILAQNFWPGPLTMVLPKSDLIPDEVSAGLDTVGIRMPSHRISKEIIKLSGCPYAAPSANLSGSPSPTTAQHVINDLNGRLDAIVDGGQSEVGLESTVITLATDIPTVLRPGGITLEQLKKVIGEVQVDPAVFEGVKGNQKVASPGMKYKHYAPRARVIIINSSDNGYINYVNSHAKAGVAALCYNEDAEKLNVYAFTYGAKNDYEEQAKELFDVLRDIDKSSCELVYARCPKPVGVGMAVYNRLIRAAGFEVIDID